MMPILIITITLIGRASVKEVRYVKINGFRPVNVNPYQKQLDKTEKTQSAKQKDQLEISQEALDLQKGSQFEVDRQQKVAELKSKVESGDYQVDPKKTAQKLYSFWDDLNN